MRVDLPKFKALYEKLFEVDYDGSVPGICVPLNSVASIRAATSKGAPFLPLQYQDNFAAPLDARLPGVMSKLDQQVQSGERPPQYRALADTLEKIALKRVDENPSDVSGYFNPYRILADLYEKNREYLKAEGIFERLATLDPGDAQIQKEIERFRELARKQDSTASPGVKK